MVAIIFSSSNVFYATKCKSHPLNIIIASQNSFDQIKIADNYTQRFQLVKVPIAANKKEFVYKIKVNPIHTILKYGDYPDFMDR